MYQRENIRVYIAWMLFMTFIPFFVVKTFHYHGSEDEKSCSHAKHSHNHLMIVRSANTPFLSLLNLNR